MGYYANAALERSYQERSCCGYPSREETLTYYLEDLQAMLSPHCDAARYAGVKGRYRYYEVPAEGGGMTATRTRRTQTKRNGRERTNDYEVYLCTGQ